MTTPYQGSDNECGYLVLSNQQLYNQILTALQQHQQLLAHCNGDAAAEQYITQFKTVLDDYSNLEACRPVMIYAQLVRHNQLQRMKAINMKWCTLNFKKEKDTRKYLLTNKICFYKFFFFW